MAKNKIEFKMNIVTGYCFTKCPYGRDCYVNSCACSACIHNFGLIDTMILRCTGERIKGVA
jgi:hypothetical protein